MNQNQLLTPITKQTRESPLPTTSLNLWTVYGICLLISTVFFFLFGFNSPIYTYEAGKVTYSSSDSLNLE